MHNRWENKHFISDPLEYFLLCTSYSPGNQKPKKPEGLQNSVPYSQLTWVVNVPVMTGSPSPGWAGTALGSGWGAPLKRKVLGG